MPPLPTGAPTTGNAALVYWSLIGTTALLLAVFGLLKFFYPSGRDRLDRRSNDESEAIAILRAQIEDMKKVQCAQGREIDELRIERENDMETRVKMHDKVQAVISLCESYYDFMQEIHAEVKGLSPHYYNRLERMKKLSDVLKRFE